MKSTDSLDDLKIMKAQRSYDFNVGNELAEAMKDIIKNPELAVDEKKDGTRAIVDIDPKGNMTIYGRGTVQVKLHSADRMRRVYNSQFPELIVLGVDRFLWGSRFDCEIVIIDEETGVEDYNLLETRVNRKDDIILYSQRYPATLEIFDITRLNGEDLMDKPLMERRYILEKLRIRALNSARILPIASTPMDKRDVMLRALKLGLEGIMIKDLSAPYVNGPGKWFKAKRTHSEDVIVLGISPGKGKFEPYFGQLHCYQFNDNKILEFICDVGGGFSFEQMAEIRDYFGMFLSRPAGDEIKIRYEQLKKIQKLMVIEIKHYGIVKTGRRHPVYMRTRTDKDPEECLSRTASSIVRMEDFI